MKRSGTLKYVGMLIAAGSLIATCIFVVAARSLSTHSRFFLDQFYGPGRKTAPSYSDLYSYAESLTLQRNHHVMILGIALGVTCLILGVVITLWSAEMGRNEKRANQISEVNKQVEK